MPIKPVSVAYCAIGGIVLFSGLKGSTLSDTVKGVLTGDLASIKNTEPIQVNNGSSGSGASGGTSGGSGGPLPTGGGTPSKNQALAKQIATQMGHADWTTGATWDDWVKLWNKESNWDTNAKNPTSTAYGIAQFLDGTWGAYGPKTSDPSLQIKYGIEYIHDRYGSPVMAWAHEQANNWY